MNSKLIIWSLVAALAGFLFGLDVAVISGAEQNIQKLWDLSPTMHGLAISIALYGTVVGAMFGGYFADLLGRKRSLFWVGLLFFISSLGSAVSPDVYTFMVLRLIGGFAIGASSVISPLYISEISTAKNRGFLVALFQFNIVFGILIAYVSNYFLHTDNVSDWRWMLGVVAIPSAIFTVLTFFISESPRWLAIIKGDTVSALKVLNEINPSSADATLAAIVAEKEESAKSITSNSFFSGKYNWQILLAFLIAFFNQASGINAIIYYAPRIFEMTGLGSKTAFLATTGVGVVNLIFTMVGLSLIDRFGRRILMYIGSIGYIVSLSLIGYAFKTQHFDGMTIFVFMFIASHAIGQGAVIWVFIGEIFPNEVRASGQSLGCFTHWIFAAFIANFFPVLASNPDIGPTKIFFSFAAMMVLQLLYVRFMMPETKGVALEDMQRQFVH